LHIEKEAFWRGSHSTTNHTSSYLKSSSGEMRFPSYSQATLKIPFLHFLQVRLVSDLLSEIKTYILYILEHFKST